LRGEISINESRAEWGAWAIVVGLVLEVIIALTVSFDIDKKWIDNWGAVIADCLIALGVYAEIHFGRKASGASRELQQRSDIKIAEANARAEEAIARAAEANERAEAETLARVELETRMAPRSLTAGQQAVIVEKIKPFGKFVFDFAVLRHDPEVMRLVGTIARVLRMAGSEIKPISGYVFDAFEGIVIDLRSGNAERFLPVSVALTDALRAEGIAADLWINENAPNIDKIMIRVGSKPAGELNI
jgi:hypothetical protein